jgi:hypothetical protein
MASKEILEKLGFTKPAGLYMLSREVFNPKPDRRYKNQFDAAPVWREGLLIRVRHYDHEQYQLPSLTCDSPGMMGSISCGDDNRNVWEPLVAALRNDPKHLGSAINHLSSNGCVSDADAILAYLMEKGKVSYEDVVETGRELSEATDDESWWAWRKAHGI